MSKEIMDGIRKTIEEAQRAKELREQQEAARRQAESRKQEAEKRAMIARNEVRLRATGVVDLFEELRDSRVLMRSSKEGDLAVISWSLDKTEIVIEFDKYDYFERDSDGGGQTVKRVKSLWAGTLKSGELKIGQHVMKREEKLGDVVRDEILKEKGLKE